MTVDYDWNNLLAWSLLAVWMILILILVGMILFYRNYPKQKATVERCERQHRQLMEGDDAGIYGDFPPARTLDLDLDIEVIDHGQESAAWIRQKVRRPEAQART